MSEVTLAKYISELREKQGFSQEGLSRRANINLNIIEDIEGAQLLFLPVVIRQKLARALKVEPKAIKAFEREPNDAKPDEEYIEQIKLNILNNKLEGNLCPLCNSELTCRIAQMYDLEDNLILHPKAHCTKCPFQIK